MTTIEPPAAIRTFIDETDRGDVEALAATFPEDAQLHDCGREHNGRDGVRDRDDTDDIGVRSRFELVGTEAGPPPTATSSRSP